MLSRLTLALAATAALLAGGCSDDDFGQTLNADMTVTAPIPDMAVATTPADMSIPDLAGAGQ